MKMMFGVTVMMMNEKMVLGEVQHLNVIAQINYSKTVPKLFQNGPKTAPKLTHNCSKTTPKLAQNCSPCDLRQFVGPLRPMPRH